MGSLERDRRPTGQRALPADVRDPRRGCDLHQVRQARL